jgi:hypothetical protein
MSDTYGGLTVPAQLPSDDGPAAGKPVDLVLDCFAAYLTAVLIANVGDMWESVAPGMSPIVRRSFTADPEDVLLNESHLPALFVWEPDPSPHQQIADDWWTTDRTIAVLWMFEPGAITQREDRMRVQNAIVTTIHSQLAMGRNPAWIDPTDTDPKAATRGSVLIKRCGLVTLPKPQNSQRVPITIVRENSDPVTYRGFRTSVLATQRFRRDPAAHGTPSAASLIVQSGGTTVESLLGP